MLALTVPRGATASDLAAALDDMESRLLARRPQPLYEFNREMRYEQLAVTVRPVDGYGERVTLHKSSDNFHFEIRVDSGVDLCSPDVVRAVGRMVKGAARWLAPRLLLPRAAELASLVGACPSGWKIASGQKVLGRCNSRGEISLSAVLVFLPADLRDYVVLHELAHLREMNHSARFHAVCDSYCGGRERELEHRLKDFRFPLV